MWIGMLGFSLMHEEIKIAAKDVCACYLIGNKLLVSL